MKCEVCKKETDNVWIPFNALLRSKPLCDEHYPSNKFGICLVMMILIIMALAAFT